MITSSRLSGDVWLTRTDSPHCRMRPRGQAVHHVDVTTEQAYSDWTAQEKRQYLGILSERVWDVEDQLARIRTERAVLMNSLRSEPNQVG
jgi:hypothetical protein